jgi:hypothetical protein
LFADTLKTEVLEAKLFETVGTIEQP